MLALVPGSPYTHTDRPTNPHPLTYIQHPYIPTNYNQSDTKRTGPEVVSVLREVPVLGRLLTSLYDCDYRGFMHALVDITPDLTRDRCVRGLHAS